MGILFGRCQRQHTVRRTVRSRPVRGATRRAIFPNLGSRFRARHRTTSRRCQPLERQRTTVKGDVKKHLGVKRDGDQVTVSFYSPYSELQLGAKGGTRWNYRAGPQSTKYNLEGIVVESSRVCRNGRPQYLHRVSFNASQAEALQLTVKGNCTDYQYEIPGAGSQSKPSSSPSDAVVEPSVEQSPLDEVVRSEEAAKKQSDAPGSTQEPSQPRNTRSVTIPEEAERKSSPETAEKSDETNSEQPGNMASARAEDEDLAGIRLPRPQASAAEAGKEAVHDRETGLQAQVAAAVKQIEEAAVRIHADAAKRPENRLEFQRRQRLLIRVGQEMVGEALSEEIESSQRLQALKAEHHTLWLQAEPPRSRETDPELRTPYVQYRAENEKGSTYWKKEELDKGSRAWIMLAALEEIVDRTCDVDENGDPIPMINWDGGIQDREVGRILSMSENQNGDYCAFNSGGVTVTFGESLAPDSWTKRALENGTERGEPYQHPDGYTTFVDPRGRIVVEAQNMWTRHDLRLKDGATDKFQKSEKKYSDERGEFVSK